MCVGCRRIRTQTCFIENARREIAKVTLFFFVIYFFFGMRRGASNFESHFWQKFDDYDVHESSRVNNGDACAS